MHKNYISPYQIIIDDKIKKTFINIDYLLITDESYLHSGGPFASSHFKIILVSDDFIGKALVQRHKLIFSLLKDEIEQQIHSLSLKLYTKEEWDTNSTVEDSPKCMGKNNEW